MLVFTHIPRTGGTSVRAVLSQRFNSVGNFDSLASLSFSRDQEINSYPVIATHCGHGIFKRITLPHEKLILLREPVERIVSHYYYLRESSEGISYASHYAKTQSLVEFVQNSNPAVLVGVEDTQTWHLVFDKNLLFRNRYKGLSGNEIVEAALANLSEYRYVGFTNSIQCLLERVWRDNDWNLNELDIPRLRRSSHPEVADLDDSMVNAIHTRVELDLQFYAAAKSAFGELV